MLLDDWQRIEKIVRWTGLSVNSFALSIGLNRSENLYRIKRGDNGISKELAELIAARYPEISRAWIITGEGGMFIGNTEERNLIPAYDIDALTLAGMERYPESQHQQDLVYPLAFLRESDVLAVKARPGHHPLGTPQTF